VVLSDRHIILVSLTLLAGFASHAQSYYDEFSQSLEQGDSVKQKELLARWEAQNPQDPELFTSYFNYYFSRAQSEVMALTRDQPPTESLALEDSTGQVAGYLGSQRIFDEEMIARGLEKIDEGIALYPDRLDMRFGKIYVLGEVENWKDFSAAILDAVRRSGENNNQWTWTHNERYPDGRNFFLTTLQGYQFQLYSTGGADQLQYMASIAKALLRLYPDHVESMSTLSVVRMVEGEFHTAIGLLTKAEEIRPEDPIVLGNLAHAYQQIGDREKSIEYYEKILRYGDEHAVEYAKEQLEILRQ